MSPREVAGDWQQACSELRQRGAHLLRSGLWADCAFLVGAAHQPVAAHRLLLGMASPVFERMYYGALPPGGEPVRVPDVQPGAFTALLEYIYTDEVKIASVSHGCGLYYAAHKYMLPHLLQVCSAYLSGHLCAADACRCYELACLFDDKTLLDKALEVISSHTKDVLEAESFLEAELSTVLMVFKQETLNIDSEIDLLIAAELYAKSIDSKSVEPRRGLQPGGKLNNLNLERHTSCAQEQSEAGNEGSQADTSSEGAVDPGCCDEDSKATCPDSEYDCNQSSQTVTSIVHDAVRQVRFLTLTPQQFAEGAARSALLTLAERFAILMNLSSEASGTPMPSGFSTSRESRDQHDKYGMKKTTIRLVVNNFKDRSEEVSSDPVVVQGLSWSLEMDPGNECEEDREVRLFLNLGVGWSRTSHVEEVEFSLLSTRPGMQLTWAEKNISLSAGAYSSCGNLIPWTEVVDPAKGYIHDGAATFEVHFTVKNCTGRSSDRVGLSTYSEVYSVQR